MTRAPSPAHNLNETARENREWIDRAHRLLDSWINDVLAKSDFHGHVSLDVIFKGGRVIGIDPATRQTIRK